MSKRPDFWSSRTGFVLATIGAAVGLGSIWKSPFEVGANGGGAFVLFYFLGLALIVFPLMLVELAVGRRGRSHAAAAIANVAQEVGSSRAWVVIGIAGIVTAFLILSFIRSLAAGLSPIPSRLRPKAWEGLMHWARRRASTT